MWDLGHSDWKTAEVLPTTTVCFTFLFLTGRRLWRGHFWNHTNSGWSRRPLSKFCLSRKKEKCPFQKSPSYLKTVFWAFNKPLAAAGHPPPRPVGDSETQNRFAQMTNVEIPLTRKLFPMNPYFALNFWMFISIYLFLSWSVIQSINLTLLGNGKMALAGENA